MRTQKMKPGGRATPEKPKKRKPMKVEISKSARADIAKAINHDWRTLAEDAIKALRETAGDLVDDSNLRSKTFTRVTTLANRASKLAGQLEMFT